MSRRLVSTSSTERNVGDPVLETTSGPNTFQTIAVGVLLVGAGVYIIKQYKEKMRKKRANLLAATRRRQADYTTFEAWQGLLSDNGKQKLNDGDVKWINWRIGRGAKPYREEMYGSRLEALDLAVYLPFRYPPRRLLRADARTVTNSIFTWIFGKLADKSKAEVAAYAIANGCKPSDTVFGVPISELFGEVAKAAVGGGFGYLLTLGMNALFGPPAQPRNEMLELIKKIDGNIKELLTITTELANHVYLKDARAEWERWLKSPFTVRVDSLYKEFKRFLPVMRMNKDTGMLEQDKDEQAEIYTNCDEVCVRKAALDFRKRALKGIGNEFPLVNVFYTEFSTYYFPDKNRNYKDSFRGWMTVIEQIMDNASAFRYPDASFAVPEKLRVLTSGETASVCHFLTEDVIANLWINWMSLLKVSTTCMMLISEAHNIPDKDNRLTYEMCNRDVHRVQNTIRLRAAGLLCLPETLETGNFHFVQRSANLVWNLVAEGASAPAEFESDMLLDIKSVEWGVAFDKSKLWNVTEKALKGPLPRLAGKVIRDSKRFYIESSVPFLNEWFGDPAPGQLKRLIIRYRRRTATVSAVDREALEEDIANFQETPIQEEVFYEEAGGSLALDVDIRASPAWRRPSIFELDFLLQQASATFPMDACTMPAILPWKRLNFYMVDAFPSGFPSNDAAVRRATFLNSVGEYRTHMSSLRNPSETQLFRHASRLEMLDGKPYWRPLDPDIYWTMKDVTLVWRKLFSNYDRIGARGLSFPVYMAGKQLQASDSQTAPAEGKPRIQARMRYGGADKMGVYNSKVNWVLPAENVDAKFLGSETPILNMFVRDHIPTSVEGMSGFVHRSLPDGIKNDTLVHSGVAGDPIWLIANNKKHWARHAEFMKSRDWWREVQVVSGSVLNMILTGPAVWDRIPQ